MPQKLVQPAGLDQVRFTTKAPKKGGPLQGFYFLA
jgi:hypothetical protein